MNIFHRKILKVFYLEIYITGALPIVIVSNGKSKTLKVSKFMKGFTYLWIIILIITCTNFIRKCIKDDDIEMNDSIRYVALVNFYIFSCYSFYEVATKVDKIISLFNRISKEIDNEKIDCLLSNGIIFEFFVTNIVYTLLDSIFYFKEDYSFWDINTIPLLISLYPRRFIGIVTMIILHLMSEVLKILNKRELNADTTHEVLVCVIEILIKIDKFTQFSLIMNSIMWIKNSFATFAFLIKSLLNPVSGKVYLDVFYAVYLPFEAMRIYTIVNICFSVQNEVK